MAESKIPEAATIDERVARLEQWVKRMREWVASVDEEKYELTQRVQRLEGLLGVQRKTLGMIALVCCLFAGACGGGPTSPTVVHLPANPATATKQPTPAPVPSAPVPTVPAVPTVQTGLARFGCISSTVADILNWELPASLVPDGAVITKAYSHTSDPNPTCQPVVANLRTENDHLRFWRHFSTPNSALVVQFDAFIFNCGSAQVDISVDGVNVLAVIVNYPEPCMDPPPPPPPPTCTVDCNPEPPCTVNCEPPVCLPGDPDCDKGGPPPPSYACMDPGVVVNARVYNGEGTFTVTEGHTVVVSLVSFSKEDGVFLPQKFVARQFGTFGPGAHRLYLEPAWPHRQEDLFCSPEYPEGEDLTEENVAYWDARVLAHDESLRAQR